MEDDQFPPSVANNKTCTKAFIGPQFVRLLAGRMYFSIALLYPFLSHFCLSYKDTVYQGILLTGDGDKGHTWKGQKYHCGEGESCKIYCSKHEMNTWEIFEGVQMMRIEAHEDICNI